MSTTELDWVKTLCSVAKHKTPQQSTHKAPKYFLDPGDGPAYGVTREIYCTTRDLLRAEALIR